MTRKEAINELKYAQAMCQFDPSTGEVRFRNKEDELQYEAFSIAIEALQQPERKSGQLLYHHTENIDEVKSADVYFCSSCKKEVLKKIRLGMFSRELDIQYDYCPHCGADMKGGSYR